MKTEKITPKGFQGALTIRRMTFEEKTDFQESTFKLTQSVGDNTGSGFNVMKAGKKKLFELIVGVDLTNEKTGEKIETKDDFEYEFDAINEVLGTLLGAKSGDEKEKLAEGNEEAK